MADRAIAERAAANDTSLALARGVISRRPPLCRAGLRGDGGGPAACEWDQSAVRRCAAEGSNLAVDFQHGSVVALISRARHPRRFVGEVHARGFIQAQHLPAGRLIVGAAAAYLPDEHDRMTFLGRAVSVDFHQPFIAVVTKLDASFGPDGSAKGRMRHFGWLPLRELWRGCSRTVAAGNPKCLANATWLNLNSARVMRLSTFAEPDRTGLTPWCLHEVLRPRPWAGAS